ncbi:MAG TPA: LssY C-terminal domain-containing protein [Thermoanaerobaculia bacterium]|nr:LssY C-terminal domain-containing protein [Thermoanaerobaculia bacterium]
MRFLLRTLAAALLLLPAYALFAYVVMPVSWLGYHRFAGGSGAPACVTRTLEGIAADPLNVALVGSREDIAAALEKAGWSPADRITLRSGLRDATSVLFHRPYVSAPVSTHVLRGRPQDLAFEQIVGGSPRRRHHVRLWRANDPKDPHATVWLGAATYDRGLGFSRYTGEVVHRIETRVDTERDKLVADLVRERPGAGVDCTLRVREAGRGVNGGGDVYETDGRLCTTFVGAPASVPEPFEIEAALKGALPSAPPAQSPSSGAFPRISVKS